MKQQTDKKQYVTLKNGGTDFRKMAQIMTDAGYKMNHATARNQLIIAMENLVGHVSSSLKTKLTKKQIKDIVNAQEIHDDLADIIFAAYKEIEQEGSVNEK